MRNGPLGVQFGRRSIQICCPDVVLMTIEVKVECSMPVRVCHVGLRCVAAVGAGRD